MIIVKGKKSFWAIVLLVITIVLMIATKAKATEAIAIIIVVGVIATGIIKKKGIKIKTEIHWREIIGIFDMGAAALILIVTLTHLGTIIESLEIGIIDAILIQALALWATLRILSMPTKLRTVRINEEEEELN